MWKVILVGLLLGSSAHASEYFLVQGKQGTKVDAVRELLREPGAEVVRCVPQMLTERLTLKAKKK